MSKNLFMVNTNIERQGKVKVTFLGFMTGFGVLGSGFYDLP
jgi:hypothetical protein